MKQILIKIISILIGLTLGILLGEVISRLYIFGLDGLSYKKVSSFTKFGESGYTKNSSNAKILYEIKPNINGYFKLKKLTTNAFGSRDKTYTLEKQKNTIRGIVIGDSFTMGSGVNIEDTYHSKIEKELNHNSDSIQYELFNFGVPGYNLLNYLGVLEEKVLRYNPDFLIIGFCSRNDIKLPNKKHLDGNYEPKKKSRNPFYTSFLAKLVQSIFNSNASSEKNLSEKQKAFIDQMFQKYSEFSAQHNIPLILTYLSMEDDAANLQIIKNLSSKNNLPFAYSTEKFNYNDPLSYQVNVLDAHPNDAGHQIFANTLLSFPPFLDILKKKSQGK